MTLEKTPQHIAIIMDGNGRWAAKRHLPRIAGHKRGVETVRDIVATCLKRDIKYLTLFAFSSENWRRPKSEVSILMKLFYSALKEEMAQLQKQQIRLKIAGDTTRFDETLQKLFREAEQSTALNQRMTLTICANYGGRWDILQAFDRMQKARQQNHRESALSEMRETNSQTSTFDENEFSQYLALAHAPDPELLIRTSGEQRISNFLLWQLAYTELYFTEQYWPDFDEADLEQAILAYQKRERRFGQINANKEVMDDVC